MIKKAGDDDPRYRFPSDIDMLRDHGGGKGYMHGIGKRYMGKICSPDPEEHEWTTEGDMGYNGSILLGARRIINVRHCRKCLLRRVELEYEEYGVYFRYPVKSRSRLMLAGLTGDEHEHMIIRALIGSFHDGTYTKGAFVIATSVAMDRVCSKMGFTSVARLPESWVNNPLNKRQSKELRDSTTSLSSGALLARYYDDIAINLGLKKK